VTDTASSARPWEVAAPQGAVQSVWLPIDDGALFLALVREAVFALSRSANPQSCLLVDSWTAERIEALEHLISKVGWACVAGEIPERWRDAPEVLNCIQAEALGPEDHLLAVISPCGSCFIHFQSEVNVPDELDGRGRWTAERNSVRDGMNAILGEVSEPTPCYPESEDSAAEQRFMMRLMRRVVELFEVRQLHALKDRNDFSAVLEILKSLSARQDAHSIMYTFVEQIAKHIGVDRCSVVRVPPREGTAQVIASHEDRSLQDIEIRLDKYPEIARAVDLGEEILINDVSTHPLMSDQREALEKAGFRSIIVVPIVHGDPQVGALLVRALRRSGGFDPREVNFVQVVAEAGAIALERVELFQSLQRSNEELAHQAATDALTGLYNRRYFTRRFEQEHSRATRYNLPLSCLLLDIDNFKQLNDRFGHLAGDDVLRELAERLLNSTRAHDIVARYGGEEFVAVLPQTAGIGARVQAERLLARVSSQPFRGVPETERVTVSIGVAVFDHASGESPEQLLQRADEALYRAKHEGKNRVVIADAPSKR
jgi:two-component system, cell cycle response regulator